MAATLELAISAIRSGRKEEGRQLLNLLIQENPNNDKAWLWMSSVVNTDEQRARCLYHVLAIDPNSEIARRGLNLLGIVVSDSRPVKIPRDSRPILIPKPTPPGQERRPFLIDPQAIAGELPFTPVTAPSTENVQASPSVLSIDVEDEVAGQDGEEASQENQTSATVSPKAKEMDTQPLPGQSTPSVEPANPQPTAGTSLETQQMPSPSQLPNAQPQNPSGPVPVVQNVPPPGVASQPQSNQMQPQPNTQIQTSGPLDTTPPSAPNTQSSPHPSQPLSAHQQPYPTPPPGMAGHANVTMGMPTQQPLPPQSPSQPAPPIHSNTTMGMPLPAYNQQPQHPSEPVPVIHSSAHMGMPPYGQPQMPPQSHQGAALHSSSTMMMPSLSEVEARAWPAAGQPVPTATPNPMLWQNTVPQSGDPMINAYGSMHGAGGKFGEDEEEGVNILAVIIFGTLSITALGGLGMLILLIFTTPPA